MSFERGAATDASYVQITRTGADGRVGTVTVSRAAMHLHTFGVLTGIESATPGFVSDAYLDSVRAETTLPALELTVAGLWERTRGGYRIATTDLLGVADSVMRRLEGMAVRCETEGGHRLPLNGSGGCSRCGTQQSVPAPVARRPRFRP